MRNLKYAIRYLWRNKTSSILNIAGLSLGITSALLIFLFIRHELSYDTFHTNKDRIYRIGHEVTRGANVEKNGNVTLAMKKVLEEEFPQIDKSAITVFEQSGVFTIDPANDKDAPKKFKEEFGAAYVQPEFYEMFDFKWLAGDYKKVLSEPNSAAISKKEAEKFFGATEGRYNEVIGRIFKYNNNLLFTVNGVFEDPPDNTDFPFRIVISQITHYNNSKEDYESWFNNNSAFNIYVLLKKGVSQKDFDAQLAKKTIIDNTGAKTVFFSQPLSDLHFNGTLANYNLRTVSKNLLFALALIAAFLVLTACINFINLATAQVVTRSKAAGIKKILGIGRLSLFSYFMQEIAVIVFFSAALSAGLCELLSPVLSEALKINLKYSFLTDVQAFGFLLALSITTVFIAGAYPSLLLTKAAPIKAALGGLNGGNKKGLTLRRFLIVFQFVLSQVLIIGVLVISEQIEFFKTKDLGFDKEFVLLTGIPPGELSRNDYLYNSFTALPNVKDVSFSFNSPSKTDWSWNAVITPENARVNGTKAEIKPVDKRFIDLYKLKLLAGRNFEDTDDMNHIIINETLMRKAGINDPEKALGFGYYFGGSDTRMEVIGVIKDFYLASLREKIEPMYMIRIQEPLNYYAMSANIKLKGFASVEETRNTVKEIENILKASFPSEIFDIRFLDEAIYRYYADEERISNLIKFFAAIAILIGCIGLYGLISFIAAHKTKEIGVRKVLGASVSEIAALLSKEFIILMIISFVISWPLAYYFMNKWLNDYPERISLGFGIFAAAGIAALAVSAATISFQTVKAATANPVESLKYE